jgi:hypothetical protein
MCHIIKKKTSFYLFLLFAFVITLFTLEYTQSNDGNFVTKRPGQQQQQNRMSVEQLSRDGTRRPAAAASSLVEFAPSFSCNVTRRRVRASTITNRR